MTKEHSLSIDSERVVIFTPTADKNLFEGSLDKSDQLKVLKRIRTVLNSGHPPGRLEKPFKGVRNLKQLAAGGSLRIYCTYQEDAPKFDILYVYDVTNHEYDKQPVTQVDPLAGKHKREISELEHPAAARSYLNERGFFNISDLDAVIAKLS